MAADITIPDTVDSSVADRLRAAADELSTLTVENRVYVLDPADAPDDVELLEESESGLDYYVDGEHPMFSDIVIKTEGEDVVIGAEFAGRMTHWQEPGLDLAAEFWEVLEEHDIERPENDPLHGVKFRRDLEPRRTFIDNVIRGAATASEDDTTGGA